MENAQDLILEFLNTLWSRRWYAVAVTWFVCLVGWGAVATMPDQYEVSARVFVDTSSILRPLLRGIAVEPDVVDEVALMRQTLLSRGNVEKVMRMTDLDLEVTTREEKDELILTLQERMTISSGAGEQNLFSLKFLFHDPVRARDVVQAFTTVFVENNIGENRNDAEVAREFLEEQTQFYRQQLEESEQRLANFQREYADLLPESAGSASSNYFSAQSALNEAIAQRDELKRQFSAISPYIEISNDAAGFGAGPPSSGQVQMAELESTIEVLLSRYTENHPDVIIANRRMAAMKERLEASRAKFEASRDGQAPSASIIRQSNPVYQALKIELVQSETNIGALRQRFEATEHRWQQVQARADRAPLLVVQQQKLQRDYGIVKAKFEQLLDRQEAMKISTDRSIKSDDVKFRIVDPPIVPIKPVGPNRPLFLFAVLFIGLGAGLGSATLLVITRQTFQNVRVLRSSFSIPVYGAIRDLNIGLRRGKVVLDFLGVSLAGGSLVAVLLLLLLLENREGLPNIATIENAPQAIEQLKRIIYDGKAILEGRV